MCDILHTKHFSRLRLSAEKLNILHCQAIILSLYISFCFYFLPAGDQPSLYGPPAQKRTCALKQQVSQSLTLDVWAGFYVNVICVVICDGLRCAFDEKRTAFCNDQTDF